MSLDLGYVLTAMVTPFDREGRLDLQQAKRLAHRLVESGSDGVVVAGTTGESPTLTKEEKIALFSAVAEEIGGRATVVAGTGGNDTATSVELTRAAEKSGVDAIMVVTPYYNKPSQEGLYQHFRAVATSTNLPVMLYNVPGRTAVNLLPSTVARLARDVPNIVALKEASGNLDQVSELRRLLPDDFALYSGDDALTLPILALGGRGVVSVVAHLVGARLKEMISAYHSGNVTLAAKIHRDLYPLMKGMFITTNPVPVKAALNLLGFNVGPPRLPLVEANQVEKEKLAELLREAGLL
ncbi:4-hydroxy-tetrahydrodipicolinate synthase [Desulfothermobacter acidiphilus]|uniref:4-hydroxy-tetrahydrodipicolinate synthase n=1 Tax=Desulfothermobacter acidiphilus TaxID=1938353 RepID=UPI003F897465